jgi:hypothetical protein
MIYSSPIVKHRALSGLVVSIQVLNFYVFRTSYTVHRTYFHLAPQSNTNKTLLFIAQFFHITVIVLDFHQKKHNLVTLDEKESAICTKHAGLSYICLLTIKISNNEQS